MQRYSDIELETLRRARKLHPGSQRALAALIHYEYYNYPALAVRSRQSIYGALRRLEAQVAVADIESQLQTA